MTLVDTDGQGVERLTEHGVVVDGIEYEVDCLVFATGFEVGTTYTRRAGYDIIGRDGMTLSQKWSEGLRTLHGLQTNGFPNCFFLGFTQTAVTVSMPHALERAGPPRRVHPRPGPRARRAQTVEATSEAEDAWVRRDARQGPPRPSGSTAECTPGYYNNEGKLGNPNGFFAGTYGAGPVAFFQLLDEWRADGQLHGVALDDVAPEAPFIHPDAASEPVMRGTP